MTDPVARGHGRPWQRPALRDDGDRHRPVAWVELFFDLVFVVIIAVLADGLQSHFTPAGLVRYGVEFVAVVWVWNSFTYYTERFESAGLEGRVFVFLAILTVAGLAVWGQDGLNRDFLGFVVSYVLARLLNIVLWLRAGLYVPEFRRAAIGFAGGFVVAILLLSVSFLVSAELRLALCTAAIIVDVATPALTNRFQNRLPLISRDKFPERFGLLTMIVIGQTIAGVIIDVAVTNQHSRVGVSTLVEAGLAIAIGFAIWWIYFDFIARRPPRPVFSAALVWAYLHILTLAAIVAVGVAMASSIAEVGRPAIAAPLYFGLFLSVAATLIIIAALEATLDRSQDEPTHHLVSPGIKCALGVALIVLAAVHLPLTAIAALAVALACLAVPAGYGAIVWFSSSATSSAAA